VRRRPEADSEGHAEEPGTWAGLTARRGLAAAMAMRDGCGLTMEVCVMSECWRGRFSAQLISRASHVVQSFVRQGLI
jgi:hypothetical protein